MFQNSIRLFLLFLHSKVNIIQLLFIIAHQFIYFLFEFGFLHPLSSLHFNLIMEYIPNCLFKSSHHLLNYRHFFKRNNNCYSSFNISIIFSIYALISIFFLTFPRFSATISQPLLYILIDSPLFDLTLEFYVYFSIKIYCVKLFYYN